MVSGTIWNLQGVWGSSGNDVFAVGDISTILHYDGNPSPSTTTALSTTTTIRKQCPTEELYGEQSAETEILRYVRDNVLSQTPEGQELIRLYYQWSPVIVKAMEEDEEFREQVKGMIDGVLELIKEAE